jgi:uncharacterized membrane protein YfcA
MSYFLFFLATVLAGTINALAGGGGLITFSLLMLVVTPVTADATSAVALFFAYPTAVWRTRDQLEGVLGRGWLWLLLIPSMLGGLIGAVLLSRMGNRSFIQLVPCLVLLATVIIVLRPILVRRDETGSVCIRTLRWRCGLSQLRAFFWRDCMAATLGRDWNPDDRRAEFYLARRYATCGRAQELPHSLHARRGSPGARARR